MMTTALARGALMLTLGDVIGVQGTRWHAAHTVLSARFAMRVTTPRCPTSVAVGMTVTAEAITSFILLLCMCPVRRMQLFGLKSALHILRLYAIVEAAASVFVVLHVFACTLTGLACATEFFATTYALLFVRGTSSWCTHMIRQSVLRLSKRRVAKSL